jgi:hypothetical protein
MLQLQWTWDHGIGKRFSESNRRHLKYEWKDYIKRPFRLACWTLFINYGSSHRRVTHKNTKMQFFLPNFPLDKAMRLAYINCASNWSEEHIVVATHLPITVYSKLKHYTGSEQQNVGPFFDTKLVRSISSHTTFDFRFITWPFYVLFVNIKYKSIKSIKHLFLLQQHNSALYISSLLAYGLYNNNNRSGYEQGEGIWGFCLRRGHAR